MAVTPGFRIQDNFLFHHTTAGITDPTALSDAILHDQVLHTASTIALLLIILTTIALIIALRTIHRTGCPNLSNSFIVG